ncbi:MAG: MFS transporter [Candidatus Methylomirabilia bacterium]
MIATTSAPRFFYGWVVLAMATLAYFATAPGQSFAISIFLVPMLSELGLSRTIVSSAYSLASLTASVGLPYIGRLVDRRGGRVMMAWIAGGLGLASMALSLVNGIVPLYLAFTGIRLLGQGALALTSTALVAQWFVRQRGFAMSIVSLGFAASTAVVPPLLQITIDRVGWRAAWVYLGVVVWILIVPLAAVFVRDRPEDLGLQPDGPTSPGAGSPAAEGERREESWILSRAIRSAAFWLLALGLAVLSMLVTGLIFHQVAYFEEQGLSRQLAAHIFGVEAVFLAVATMLTGLLLDRCPARFILSSVLMLMAASIGALLVVRTPATAVLYGAVLGTTQGGLMTTYPYVWAHYFGRAHVGSIQGLAATILIAGAALGPLPLGIGYDWLGDYRSALLPQLVLPLTFAIAVLFAYPPRSEAAG